MRSVAALIVLTLFAAPVTAIPGHVSPTVVSAVITRDDAPNRVQAPPAPVIRGLQDTIDKFNPRHTSKKIMENASG